MEIFFRPLGSIFDQKSIREKKIIEDLECMCYLGENEHNISNHCHSLFKFNDENNIIIELKGKVGKYHLIKNKKSKRYTIEKNGKYIFDQMSFEIIARSYITIMAGNITSDLIIVSCFGGEKMFRESLKFIQTISEIKLSSLLIQFIHIINKLNKIGFFHYLPLITSFGIREDSLFSTKIENKTFSSSFTILIENFQDSSFYYENISYITGEDDVPFILERKESKDFVVYENLFDFWNYLSKNPRLIETVEVNQLYVYIYMISLFKYRGTTLKIESEFWNKCWKVLGITVDNENQKLETIEEICNFLSGKPIKLNIINDLVKLIYDHKNPVSRSTKKLK